MWARVGRESFHITNAGPRKGIGREGLDRKSLRLHFAQESLSQTCPLEEAPTGPAPGPLPCSVTSWVQPGINVASDSQGQ